MLKLTNYQKEVLSFIKNVQVHSKVTKGFLHRHFNTSKTNSSRKMLDDTLNKLRKEGYIVFVDNGYKVLDRTSDVKKEEQDRILKGYQPNKNSILNSNPPGFIENNDDLLRGYGKIFNNVIEVDNKEVNEVKKKGERAVNVNPYGITEVYVYEGETYITNFIAFEKTDKRIEELFKKIKPEQNISLNDMINTVVGSGNTATTKEIVNEKFDPQTELLNDWQEMKFEFEKLGVDKLTTAQKELYDYAVQKIDYLKKEIEERNKLFEENIKLALKTAFDKFPKELKEAMEQMQKYVIDNYPNGFELHVYLNTIIYDRYFSHIVDLVYNTPYGYIRIHREFMEQIIKFKAVC